MHQFMSQKGVANSKAGQPCDIYLTKIMCETIDGEDGFPLNHDDPRKVILVNGIWEFDKALSDAVDASDAIYIADTSQQKDDQKTRITQMKSLEAALDAAVTVEDLKPLLKKAFRAISVHNRWLK